MLLLVSSIAVFKLCHPSQTGSSAMLPNLGGGWRCIESTKAWLVIFVEDGCVPDQKEVAISITRATNFYCLHLRFVLQTVSRLVCYIRFFNFCYSSTTRAFLVVRGRCSTSEQCCIFESCSAFTRGN